MMAMSFYYYYSIDMHRSSTQHICSISSTRLPATTSIIIKMHISSLSPAKAFMKHVYNMQTIWRPSHCEANSGTPSHCSLPMMIYSMISQSNCMQFFPRRKKGMEMYVDYQNFTLSHDAQVCHGSTFLLKMFAHIIVFTFSLPFTLTLLQCHCNTPCTKIELSWLFAM